MSIVKLEDRFYFCPDIKSLNTVEDFLTRRWLMYKNIIFHHRVVKTDFLLQKSVEELGRIYIREGDSSEIAEETEESSNLLPNDISGLWKAMKKGTAIDKGIAICQWDDSWLMTVLKAFYFKNFMHVDGQNPHTILYRQLQEILTNEKQYVSLIKRTEDFKVIDDAFVGCVQTEEESLRKLIGQLTKVSEHMSESPDIPDQRPLIPLEGYLQVINEVLNRCSQLGAEQNKYGFILRYIMKTFNVLADSEIYPNFDKFINEIVEAVKTDFFTSVLIDDILILSKKFKVGTAKPLYFWDREKKTIHNINNISGITTVLNLYLDFFPPFFIYVLRKDSGVISDDRRVEFLKEIGEKCATVFVNITKNRLEMHHSPFELEDSKKAGGNKNV